MGTADLPRSILPIPDPQQVGLTTYDARDPETAFPPIETLRPPSGAPNVLVILLDDVGFGATSAFGGPVATPTAERLTGPMGPIDQWPTGSGFEYFYGFLGGETNQYYPSLYECLTPIEQPRTPQEGYHFTEDMTDKAIAWVGQQRSLATDKPFFMYFAPGATHAPHHVPKEWSNKYQGRFDAGWDALRTETFARQKTLGVIPEDAELTARHNEIPAWDEVPDDLKPVLARQMEVYGGFLEHTDHHVGRLIDALGDLGILEDTLIYYILGDNGASAEGTLNGTFNELLCLNGVGHLETTEFMRAHIDEFGSPAAYNHYAVGWAHAMSTPYQWTKQVASHWGGTRNGTVVHWPNGFRARGETRSQFHHVIDVAPTVLAAAGLPHPTFVHGIGQQPIEGVSMVYTFDNPGAAQRHETQYFEMFCNRGIYHRGWTAVTRHSIPWTMADTLPAIDDDTWELYNTNTDWTQAHDLAAEQPERLRKLQRLFLIEASKYNVLPLDDRRIERWDPDQAGRPALLRGTSQMLFGGMGRLSENTVLNLKDRSHSVTAEIAVPEGGARGVIIAQGGRFGGWSLYLRDGGVPTYCYNLFGLQRFKTNGATAVLPGTHQVRMEFDYDGGGLGKGGTVRLFVDGEQTADARIEATEPLVFSADETCDVGSDTASPVSDDYDPASSHFTGAVNWVQLDQGLDSHEHLITPEERLRLAMVRQ
ncbi:MAG: arylsulfatase [Pseudonocardiales bacterium]